MQIDRDRFLQEQLLRKQIRKAINMVKERRLLAKREQISEELKLRKVIRGLIQETTVGEAVPERATEEGGKGVEDLQEQEIDIEVGEEEDEAFIDVRGETEPEPEKTPEEDFGVEGEDKTGRNFAYETFKRVENQIIKGYERLDDPEDRDLFYDYLITNLKLYFDKFEDELQTSVSPEPTTPEYEEEKDKETELAPEEGEEDLGLEL